MSGTNPGIAKTQLAEAVPRQAAQPQPEEDDEAVTLGELQRALEYVERKTDWCMRELNGEGTHPGVRAQLYALSQDVRHLQQDLESQRRELAADIAAQGAEVRSELRALTAAVARLEAKRVSPWVLALLVACALIVAGAAGYGAWVQL